MVQSQQLQLLKQHQQQLLHSRQHSLNLPASSQLSEPRKANGKKSKSSKVKESSARMQEMSADSTGVDSGISSQSDTSWQDHGQVFFPFFFCWNFAKQYQAGLRYWLWHTTAANQSTISRAAHLEGVGFFCHWGCRPCPEVTGRGHQTQTGIHLFRLQ